MKTFSDAAMAAIEAGTAIVQGAVWIGADEPIRVWGGNGTLVLLVDGDPQPFLGVGDRGLILASTAQLGGAAQGLTPELSGVDPTVLEVLDADEIRKRPVIVWRLVFSGDGRTLLDAQIFDRGRVDAVPTQETIGGTATIRVQVETAARGLGRSGQRMRSDADQRLIDPNDGFFKNVAFAGQKTLYWGGRRPANAATALGGAYGTAGVGGGSLPNGVAAS